MEEEENNNDVFRNRPPNLWNEPESLMEDHKFKVSTKPLEVYKDSRVQELYERIEELAESISMTKPEKWDNLINRVIAVLENMPSVS